MAITRRRFMQWAGAGGALALAGCTPARNAGRPNARNGHVVVVGGGFGGATCAKYLRRFDPDLQVTLIERDSQFVTCPGSNWVIAGMRQMEDITHDYDALRDRHNIKVVRDSVTAVDPDARRLTLASGGNVTYDRLVISPGIDFRWDAIPGYDQAASERIPHAWKAGPQTVLLRQQLNAMPDGGTFIMTVPGDPIRCPPGPYERISLIAYYFRVHKPRAKIIVLDTKDQFSKQGLFMEGWEALYPGMIEWISGSQGGAVQRVDAAEMTVHAQESFATFKGDVINVVPPHRAGDLAFTAGLADDSGFCPVNQQTFESNIHPNVHVIGDSAIAGAMPKSGHSANNQAKMCAAAIVASLREIEVPSPSHVNTCYSLVSPDYGISIAAVYRLEDGAIAGVEGAGGVSPLGAPESFRKQEAIYTLGWYASIVQDSFG